MTSNRYDAIVIGAGHNGLIAAAYLARAELAIACDTPPLPFLQKPHARKAPSISPM